MTTVNCPRCNERIVVAFGNKDVIHECNSKNEVLDNEDVKLIGTWSDYTGSDFTQGAVTGTLRGIDDKLQGSDADIEERKRLHELTSRGKIKSTHRTRQHLEFVEIKD